MKRKLGICLDKELVEKIDELRKDVSRSLYINKILNKVIERRYKK